MHWHAHAHRGRRRRGHHGYGPWGAGGRFFGPGEVRLALLALLSEESGHGYELMKRLEARSGDTYRASAGTVYPTLQLLEDEGLVRSENRDGKRVYEITEAGRATLEDDEEGVDRIWERAEEWGDWRGLWEPGAGEIVRPALRLLKAAVRRVARSGDPATADEVRAILKRARREIDALSD